METKSNTESETGFERSLGFLVHDIARLMRLSFERRVRSVGLTRAQWFVLAHVVRNDGQTQARLGEDTDMEKAPLSKLLDRLEEGGWIERRPDPNDQRANRIYKTRKVDPLIGIMRDTTAKLYETSLEGFSIEKRERLIDDLLTIKGNLLSSLNGQGRG